MIGQPMVVSKSSPDGVDDEVESDDAKVLVADSEVAEVLVPEDSESESGNMVASQSSVILNSSRCSLKASSPICVACPGLQGYVMFRALTHDSHCFICNDLHPIGAIRVFRAFRGVLPLRFKCSVTSVMSTLIPPSIK